VKLQFLLHILTNFKVKKFIVNVPENLNSKFIKYKSSCLHTYQRDDQEPALIIANGASCNPELLGQLLEWSPLVIVLDSAMVRVMELDIKVDVL
jgi:hypothetical protein